MRLWYVIDGTRHFLEEEGASSVLADILTKQSGPLEVYAEVAVNSQRNTIMVAALSFLDFVTDVLLAFSLYGEQVLHPGYHVKTRAAATPYNWVVEYFLGVKARRVGAFTQKI